MELLGPFLDIVGLKWNKMFKINYKIDDGNGLNKPGVWIRSLIDGSTRTKGKLYQVIKNPKTQKVDVGFLHYISDKGHVVKISKSKWNTFELAENESKT